MHDIRDALRSLVATPVVSAIAVLSLALGIGANTAIFSILDSLILRTLPVEQPQRLVLLDRGSWTNPIWEAIREPSTAATKVRSAPSCAAVSLTAIDWKVSEEGLPKPRWRSPDATAPFGHRLRPGRVRQ